MSLIKIENLNINFERKGKGENKIIFLHGNTCSLKYFSKQFDDEKLLDLYELISLDFPGHGLSEYAKDTDIYTITGFARILVELCKQLNIENAILVGNSLGGNVLLEAIDDLPRVKGLVLVGAAPFGPLTVTEMFLPNPALGLFFKGELTVKDINLLSEITFYNSEKYAFLSEEIKKADPKFRELLLANSERIIPKNQIEIVKNLSTAVTVIHGSDEQIVNYEYLKKVPFKNLWKNEIITIPKTKHFPFIEQSKIFNMYLLEFCKEQF